MIFLKKWQSILGKDSMDCMCLQKHRPLNFYKVGPYRLQAGVITPLCWGYNPSCPFIRPFPHVTGSGDHLNPTSWKPSPRLAPPHCDSRSASLPLTDPHPGSASSLRRHSPVCRQHHQEELLESLKDRLEKKTAWDSLLGCLLGNYCRC